MEKTVKLIDKPEKIMETPEIKRLLRFLSTDGSDDVVEDTKCRNESALGKKKCRRRYKCFGCRIRRHLKRNCEKNEKTKVLDCKTPKLFISRIFLTLLIFDREKRGLLVTFERTLSAAELV